MTRISPTTPGREIAAGYTRLAVVLEQGLARMELLIPKTVRSILNKGRVEGRQEERKRLLAALREARARGIDPDSPEFEEFILRL